MADPPRLIVETGPEHGFEIRLATDPKPIFGKTRAPVVVAVGGHTYRSTVAAMNGGWFVPFSRSHRAAAALDPARRHTVILTLDTEPRTVEAPDDLQDAIRAAGLEPAWDRLSHTHRREHVEAIEGARRPETRARRIAACLARLG